MKKILNTLFGIGIAVWFITAVYISINSFIGFFTPVNPNISKSILAGSFLWVTVIGIYNYIKHKNFFEFNQKAGTNFGKDKPTCKTCKQKK